MMSDQELQVLESERARLQEEIEFINRGIISIADQYVEAWRSRKLKEERLAEINTTLMGGSDDETLLEMNALEVLGLSEKPLPVR